MHANAGTYTQAHTETRTPAYLPFHMHTCTRPNPQYGSGRPHGFFTAVTRAGTWQKSSASTPSTRPRKRRCVWCGRSGVGSRAEGRGQDRGRDRDRDRDRDRGRDRDRDRDMDRDRGKAGAGTPSRCNYTDRCLPIVLHRVSASVIVALVLVCLRGQ